MKTAHALARFVAHAQGVLTLAEGAYDCAANGNFDAATLRTFEADARRHLLELHRLLDQLPRAG